MRENIRFKKPDQAQLAELLSEEQYDVMVNGATERPFTSEYLKNDREGIYVDAATGEPLFTSYDQFDSECGWPSFTQPIDPECITQHIDSSHGMVRTEVRSCAGDFHLGHVFRDGPKERGGLRYCINGKAIRFVPVDDLEVEGYSYLLPYMLERKKYKK